MTRTIEIDYLTRVEGEGAFRVSLRDGAVLTVALRIFEPPRLFEGFLRGRSYQELADITARICGICPVAYQMSALAAVEDAFGVTVSEPVRRLRRLFYCGEWISSHALHVFMLHAPGFLGFDDAFQMAGQHRQVVEAALSLKRLGNDLLALVGGREIHPINARPGGFYKLPGARELASLVPRLERAIEVMRGVLPFLAALPFPDFERPYELVALKHAEEYAITGGRLVSTEGLDIAPEEFNRVFDEVQLPRSTALHTRLRGKSGHVLGPLARFNVSFAQLSPLAREAAGAIGLTAPCRNPFKSILVRAIEILYALDEARRLIQTYEPAREAAVELRPRAREGAGWTEAPRGTLYHRYRFSDDGAVMSAQIVPPTAHNQAAIEHDLRDFVERHAELPNAELVRQCEQVVRNFDPCISCATH